MSKKFAEVVLRSFSFLEEVGFYCTKCEAALLRYETNKVFVMITWDRRSGEINEFIGLLSQKGEQEDGFSISDLLAMEGADLPEKKIPFQVADENRLGPFVEKLAEDTRNYAKSALVGDRKYFQRLKAFRNSAAQTYMRSLTLQRIRSGVEKAWHGRDFATVVALYRSIENDLSDLERGRLDYAKRQTES